MKVLIVDDSPEFLGYLTEVVKSQGHLVKTAVDGVEGWAAFQEFGPDLIMSDISMPNMDGIELLKKIRRENLDVIIILINGETTASYIKEAFDHKAQNYLFKPCELTDIIELLEKYSVIVKDKDMESNIYRFIKYKEFSIDIPSAIAYAPYVANYLINEADQLLAPEDKLGVRMGLLEIIVNSIEHGNLEISCEEKRAAISKGIQHLHKLYEERLKVDSLAGRKTNIHFSFKGGACVWIVSDEGKGFNFHHAIDPLNLTNLTAPSGRGIFLARMQFDEVEYLGSGSTVMLAKKVNVAE
ncbi:MAG: response regulator [Deltaproteobacteria bacterium]|nr:response regulator [Deltaproteobacteria bacterium]